MTLRSPSLLHNGLPFRLLLLARMHPNILFQNPLFDFHLAVRGVLVTGLGYVAQKNRLVVNILCPGMPHHRRKKKSSGDQKNADDSIGPSVSVFQSCGCFYCPLEGWLPG